MLQVGAGLLCCVPKLLMNSHHRQDGICLRDKDPIDSEAKLFAFCRLGMVPGDRVLKGFRKVGVFMTFFGD